MYQWIDFESHSHLSTAFNIIIIKNKTVGCVKTTRYESGVWKPLARSRGVRLCIDLLGHTQQNSAARIICRTSRFDHITPVLKELHWLPIRWRIKHKILTLTYKALHDLSPIYMADMIQINTPSRTRRSTNELSLVTPRSRTKLFGGRLFMHATPVLWNSHPLNICESQTLSCFKGLLKTHLFI